MRAFQGNIRPEFISFSGIDGAGKSTQIEALCAHLRGDGLQVQLIRFWDDIARLTRFREATGHIVFKGDKGVGSPSAPINRRDKNVRSLPMTVVRLFLYFIDAISVRFSVEKALHSGADLVIFDRYIYDELANLNLRNRAIQMYCLLIMKLVPKPAISYLLDADPVKARMRKPEYPLEFLNSNRQSYLSLRDLIGGITLIPPMPLDEVKREVLRHALSDLSFGTSQRTKRDGEACEDLSR